MSVFTRLGGYMVPQLSPLQRIRRETRPRSDHLQHRLRLLLQSSPARVLQNPSPSFLSGDAVYPQMPKSFPKIHGFTGRFHCQREHAINIGMGEDLLPQSEADKIEAMLLELKESSEFHKRPFECAVDSIQAIAASHLWQLVVVRADLNGHLKGFERLFSFGKRRFLPETKELSSSGTQAFGFNQRSILNLGHPIMSLFRKIFAASHEVISQLILCYNRYSHCKFFAIIDIKLVWINSSLNKHLWENGNNLI